MKVVRLSRGAKKRPKRGLSEAEEDLAEAWGDREPRPEREWRFHPTRKWRFDFAWPGYLVALEIEGLGRHQKVEGYALDCEKYSEAACLGWRIVRVMARDRAKAKGWVELVQRALEW